MRKRAPIAMLAAATVLSVAAAPGQAEEFVLFSSPSHGIGCVLFNGVLRCDVKGGIIPLPPRPKTCNLGWGQGYNLVGHGPAGVVCAGDTALGAPATIPYGSTWRRGDFACASSTNGMRCTNADGRGFFISRGDSHTF